MFLILFLFFRGLDFFYIPFFEFVINCTVAFVARAGYLTSLDSFDDLTAFFLFVRAFRILALAYVVVKLRKARGQVFKLKKVEVNEIYKTKAGRVCKKRRAVAYLYREKLNVARRVSASLYFAADVACFQQQVGEEKVDTGRLSYARSTRKRCTFALQQLRCVLNEFNSPLAADRAERKRGISRFFVNISVCVGFFSVYIVFRNYDNGYN